MGMHKHPAYFTYSSLGPNLCVFLNQSQFALYAFYEGVNHAFVPLNLKKINDFMK